ncbi:MAG: hypothetical protein AB8B87_16750 [Granulosicoccus sp.]
MNVTSAAAVQDEVRPVLFHGIAQNIALYPCIFEKRSTKLVLALGRLAVDIVR